MATGGKKDTHFKWFVFMLTYSPSPRDEITELQGKAHCVTNSMIFTRYSRHGNQSMQKKINTVGPLENIRFWWQL